MPTRASVTVIMPSWAWARVRLVRREGSVVGAEPSALALLELDLDARLLSSWVEVWKVEGLDRQVVAPFLRVSYWTGYMDALTEGSRGKLLRDHGQPVPIRKRASGRR